MTWFEVVPLVVAVICLLDGLLVAGLYVTVRRNERRARALRARGRVIELWRRPVRESLVRSSRATHVS